MTARQHLRHISSMSTRRHLSTDELSRILSIAKEDPSLRDLYEVASFISYTGIRLHEFSVLRWADVDFTNSRAVISSTKTFSRRCIPIGPHTLEILKARRSRNPESDFVLGCSRMVVLHRVARQLRELGNMIGVGLVSASVLRHTFFRRLFATGGAPWAFISIAGCNPSIVTVKFVPDPIVQCIVAAPYIAQIEEQI